MRRLGRAVVVAGLAWAMVGCGGVAVRSAATSGVMLSDGASGTQYELGVADGALTLTGLGGSGVGSSGAAADAGLTDSATGTGYLLGVANGALTVEPGPVGAKEIGMVDSVTAKTYELAVAGGALTLIAVDGGGK